MPALRAGLQAHERGGRRRHGRLAPATAGGDTVGRAELPREAIMSDDTSTDLDTQTTISTLNKILELELAGVVRYLHYSFMIFGYNRIPICKWLRDQSDEGRGHAVLAGEHITSLGGHPSLKIGTLLETQKHSIEDILNEARDHERIGLDEYRKLLKLVEGRNIMLEEYARTQIAAEEQHLAEIGKMMRRA
jgi:bacterioferritin